MLNDIAKAAVDLRKDLEPTEDAADDTLGHIGKLLHTAMEARKRVRMSARIPASVGQDVIEHLTSAAAMMGAVRGKIVTAHEGLVGYYRDFAPEVAVGDFPCDPQYRGKGAVAEPLRIVA